MRRSSSSARWPRAASGEVKLQRAVSGSWNTVLTGTLAKGCTFALGRYQPVGSNVLRVVFVGPPATVSLPFFVTVENKVSPDANNGVWSSGRQLSYPQERGPGSGRRSARDRADSPAPASQCLPCATDGTLRGWGLRHSLALGGSGPRFIAVPRQIPGLASITQVATNGEDTLALRADGTVWWWGTSRRTEVPAPYRQVGGLSDIVAVAGGFWNAHVFARDGTVLTLGQQRHGVRRDTRDSQTVRADQGQQPEERDLDRGGALTTPWTRCWPTTLCAPSVMTMRANWGTVMSARDFVNHEVTVRGLHDVEGSRHRERHGVRLAGRRNRAGLGQG